MIQEHNLKSGEIINLDGFSAHIPFNYFHTFRLTQKEMTLSISSGECFFMNDVVYQSEDSGQFTVPTVVLDLEYQIWLTRDGIQIVYQESGGSFGLLTNPIFILATFRVPANATTLDNIDIHAIYVDE